MEINNSNINRINNTPIHKKEKTKPSNQVEEKDYSNCPNPAEYLGRSQVVFRGNTVDKSAEIKKDDLAPIKLKKCDILPKEELVKFLQNLGYKEDEISQIDLENEKTAKGLSGVFAYLDAECMKADKDEIVNDFKTRSSEDRLKFINDELQDMAEEVVYANQENIEILNKYIDYEPDYIFEVIGHIFGTDNPEKMLENIPLAYYAQGKLTPSKLYDLKHADIDESSYERANILRKINEFFPEDKKLPLAQSDNLGTDEELTPKNVEKYLKILEKYSQNSAFDLESLKPVYENKTLKDITDDMEQVDSVLEQYPINFETSGKGLKLSKPDLERLTKRSDIKDVQGYINSLTPEAKSVGIINLPDETSTIDKSKLAQIWNIVSDKDYGDVSTASLANFLKSQEENGYKNLDGMIKLIQRYKGTNNLDTSYIERELNVANDDYDSAITALDLKDEIKAKKLNLSDYYFFEAFHNPDCDLKNFNKILQYINDNNLKPDEYDNGYYRKNYHEWFFTDPKGLNKLVLHDKIGKYMCEQTKKELFDLAEILNNEEEVNLVVDLMKQEEYPGEDYSAPRFGQNIASIKDVIQLYQEDKEGTKTILDMQTDEGKWRFYRGSDVAPVIKLYQSDKELFTDVINLKNDSNRYRYYSSEDIQNIMEAARIDKDYAFELVNLKNEFSRRKDSRFDPKEIKYIVKSAQIDKDFTNYLLNETYTDEYDQKHYRVSDSEDYIFFAKKAQEDKDYVTSLFEMKSKRYDGTEFPRLSERTIKCVLDNPPENKEFLQNIINAKKEEWGTLRNVYDNYQIADIAQATKINKDLTERMLNEKIRDTSFNQIEEHNRFNRTSDISYIVQQSVVDPEFTTEILNYTEKNWNDDIMPRFNEDDIMYLLRLRENGVPKEDITELINKTMTCSNNRVVPRYRAGEIYQIFDFYKIDKELTDKLLPNYYVPEIKSIFDGMKIDKEYTNELLEKNENSELKHSGSDIYSFVYAAQTDKELTQKLADMKIKDKKGNIQYRFDGDDIYALVISNSRNLEKVKKYALAKDANGEFLKLNLIDSLSNSENEILHNILDKKTDEGNLALTGSEIEKLKESMKSCYNTPEELTNSEEYINTVINMCKDEKYRPNDISLYTNFHKFLDKKHVYELTKLEKKDLLMTLLFNKRDMVGENHLNNELIPSGDGYAPLIKKITNSLSIDLPPLSKEEQEKFDSKLNALADELKTADLSDLSEIKLTVSQDEFKSKVTDLIKNLDKDEQAKIQDYFGFRIEKNNLVGYPTIQDKDLSTSEITDKDSLEALNKLKDVVEEYANNNFVTVKDKPALNKLLNDISKDMPEIYNQVDNTGLFVDTIKSLQKVVQNPKFDKLSESDKKVMVISTLLHNTDKISNSTSESAFDAYFISKKVGATDEEAQKIYKVVESSDLINRFMSTTSKETAVNTRSSHIRGKDRENVFDLLAFNLKEDNIFELSQMLYTTKEVEGLTRHLDKLLESRINEIKSSDFFLPQTSQQTYLDYSVEQEINGHNVKVVQADSVPNMHAYIHTPEAGYATGGSRNANLANFEIFKDFSDDKVICTSYVTPDKAALVREFHHGFIFDVKNEKQYVAYNRDIFSLSKNIPNMLIEYYRDKGFKANRNKGEKFTHRTHVSDKLKEYMGITDEEYIKKLDNIKSRLGKETLTSEKLKSIDSDLYNAYEKLFSSDDLLNGKYHNELLVSSPQISAIFTNNIDNLPEEYLIMAEEQNLPIVVFDTNKKEESNV